MSFIFVKKIICIHVNLFSCQISFFDLSFLTGTKCSELSNNM
ncbi:hypothetical protein KOY_00443 [Bacillus cereus VDM021]|nr:hypothetical protein IIW_00499 [Bacillus cereus VD136]EOP74750.1 hypothetical protein KOW_02805 [Bacillus cereus VDM006]EOQ14128.1 hypothetical protein KOY_00443 [Bacillus cereus VDM021]